MGNPYQPSSLIDQTRARDERDHSCFSAMMGVLAAFAGTPLMSLFVVAVAWLVITTSGMAIDQRSLVDQQPLLDDAIIWTGIAVALCGTSAYFACRSANDFFAGDRRKGGANLVISFGISIAILVFVCVSPLLG